MNPELTVGRVVMDKTQSLFLRDAQLSGEDQHIGMIIPGNECCKRVYAGCQEGTGKGATSFAQPSRGRRPRGRDA